MADTVFLNGDDSLDMFEIGDGLIEGLPIGDEDCHAVHHPILVDDFRLVLFDSFQQPRLALSACKEDDKCLGAELLGWMPADGYGVAFNSLLCENSIAEECEYQ